MEIKTDTMYNWPLIEALIEIKMDNLRYWEVEEMLKEVLCEELMTTKHSALLAEFKAYTGDSWSDHPQTSLIN